MTIRNFNNVTSVGTLSAPLASSATSTSATGFTGYPTTPFTATIDRNTATEEIVLVTSIAGSTINLQRGYDGTAAIAHAAGATIEHTAGAIEYQEANAHTNATANVHGATGNVVGDQGAQSIFDKTMVSPVLQADATAGDAAVAYDPTGTRNLFRGMDSNGDDVFVVDPTGKVTTTAGASVAGAASVGGVLSANGGVTVPSGKSVTANGGTTTTTLHATGAVTLDTTLAVTGAATLSGAAALNGGATVPTGKKLTLVDSPAATTDAANKSYVDGATKTSAQISDAASAPTASKVVIRDGSGRAQFADPAAAQDAATKNYVDSRPVLQLRRVASQSIPVSTPTPIAWDTADLDPGGLFTATSSAIAVSKAGYYQVYAVFGTTDTVVGGLQITLLKNGATCHIGRSTYIASNAAPDSVDCQGVVQLAAGDTIGAQVLQTSGFIIHANSTQDGLTTSLSVVFLRP